jgi:hypothetical protein
MLMLILAALGLSAGAQVRPDSVAIYSVILEQVRADHPGTPVVMAETRSGVSCMPHCGAALAGEPPRHAREAQTSHSRQSIRRLRKRGLINATCPPVRGTFGCPGHPRHIFVGLGDIAQNPPDGPPAANGGYWVKVALLVPCAADCASRGEESAHPNGFGYWAFVQRPTTGGTWCVTRRLPAFAL